MIRVNLDDGQTLSLDLDTPDDALAWNTFETSRQSQGGIRGLSVARGEFVVTVPRPGDFRDVTFAAEAVAGKDGVPVADKITIRGDDVSVSVVLYRRTGLARIDLRRPGKPRFLSQFERRDPP